MIGYSIYTRPNQAQPAATPETLLGPILTPINWWLLRANLTEARKNELLAAADRVNGTVVAKPQTSQHSLSFPSGSELLIERLKSFAVQNELGTIQKCGGVKIDTSKWTDVR